MATCLQYASQQASACTGWGTTQRTACTTWGSTTRTTCSSWGMFAWLCLFFTTIVEWTCLLVEVITESVCLGWVLLVSVVCIVWEAVLTIATAVFEVVEAVLGWLFSLVASIVDLIFSIPYVGRALKWLWNIIITATVTAPVTIGEGLLYFLGIRPQKKLRLCTILARDEAGNLVAPVGQVITLLNNTIDIFRDRLNIQILNSAPAQFSSGFTDTGPRAHEGWVHVSEPSWPTAQLDGLCSRFTPGAFGEDLGPVGSAREFGMIGPCFFGAWRRLTGFGAPVTVFVLRSLGGGLFIGCALGPLTDYVTIAVTFTPGGVDANADDVADVIALAAGTPGISPSPSNLLAHELGHKCNLWHETAPTNLMTPGQLTGTSLTDFQIALVRGSRHVSFL